MGKLEQILKNAVVDASLLIGLSGAVSGCVATRYVTSPNAPPIISDWMVSYDGAGKNRTSGPHKGIDIGGRGYFGHEIVAPADGTVVSVDYSLTGGNHVKIYHGQDIDGKRISTIYMHMQKQLVEEGQKVKRGQPIGLIGETGSEITPGYPHVHFFVLYENTDLSVPPRPDPHNYWFGIDEYKEELKKNPNISPFVIPCFDTKSNYSEKPIRFTLPVKCK